MTQITVRNRVCAADDVPAGEGIRVQLDEPVAVFNDDGRFYALSDTCSHAEASLSDGYVEDGTVECPLHSSRFDLATGKPLCRPATEPVRSYRVTVEDGVVYIHSDART